MGGEGRMARHCDDTVAVADRSDTSGESIGMRC